MTGNTNEAGIQTGVKPPLIRMNLYLDKMGIVLVVILTFIIFAVLDSQFLTWTNILNMIRQTAINGILAAGMTFVILTGGIDLSVGAIVALSGVCGVYFSLHMPTPLAVLLGVCVGALAGFVNGFLTAKTRLPSIIVTLGSMTYLRGIAYVVTGGYPLVLVSESFKKIGMGYLGPVPIPIVIMLLVYVVFFVILRYTVFGRSMYAIGANPVAARLNGTDPGSAGVGMEFAALTVVLLGGVAFDGGRGKIAGVLLAVLFLGVLDNGLILLNVDQHLKEVIQGLALVLAAGLDVLGTRIAARVQAARRVAGRTAPPSGPLLASAEQVRLTREM